MTINQHGDFEEDSTEIILDALVSDVEDNFDDDLPPSQSAAVRRLYQPIASRLNEFQGDLGLVLASTQIDNAEGTALDLLTALIGVQRRPADKASGEATFSRDTTANTDYVIQEGTEISTEGVGGVRFVTTEYAFIPEGGTSVTVPIKAKEAGPSGNVGGETIVRFIDKPTGIEQVTNTTATEGGSDEENDDELRDRAQEQLADGSRATANALLSAVKGLEQTKSVTIFINDGGPDSDTSLPEHSFELVVEGGTDQDIAEAVMDTKAAGDTSWYGVNGSQASATVELINGQQFDIYFSRPTVLTLFASISLEVTEEYAGDAQVMDNIVEYIGGVYSTGNTEDGLLRVGDDVVINEIESRVMNVPGVYDIASLDAGTSDPPSGSSNVVISDTEVASTDAVAGDIEISTTVI